MKTITKHYEINASIQDVWASLTDAERIEAWGGGPASMDAKNGGSYNMWGDYLHGTITKLVTNERLEQDWVVDGMSEPSKVVFTLSTDGNQTILLLEHSNVPDELEAELDEGWDEYYLGAIKQYLEN